MKRNSKYFLTIAVVLVIISVLNSCEFFLGPFIPKGSISGYIVDGESALPLAGVEVSLAGDSYRDIATTDEKGFFQLLDVPTNSSYSLTFERDGYFSTYWNNILVEENKDFALYDPVGLNLGPTLVPWYNNDNDLKVSGTVKDRDLISVNGAQITLRPGIYTEVTDDQEDTGFILYDYFSFRIEKDRFDKDKSLHPGYFTLEVSAEGYVPQYYVVFLLPGIEVTIEAVLTSEESLL